MWSLHLHLLGLMLRRGCLSSRHFPDYCPQQCLSGTCSPLWPFILVCVRRYPCCLLQSAHILGTCSLFWSFIFVCVWRCPCCLLQTALISHEAGSKEFNKCHGGTLLGHILSDLPPVLPLKVCLPVTLPLQSPQSCPQMCYLVTLTVQRPQSCPPMCGLLTLPVLCPQSYPSRHASCDPHEVT